MTGLHFARLVCFKREASDGEIMRSGVGGEDMSE